MEFLSILFFAKTVLLTPVPIDLYGDLDMRLRTPLTAITSGASIQVNVSSMISKSEKEGILEFGRRVESAFPPGTIQAKLTGNDGQEVKLSYEGNYAYSSDAVLLTLTANNGVPKNVEFERIIITSHIKLKSVLLSWKNHKH